MSYRLFRIFRNFRGQIFLKIIYEISESKRHFTASDIFAVRITASAIWARTLINLLIFSNRQNKLTGRFCRSVRPVTAIRLINRFSAFAGNTNMISPELLVEDGFLTTEEINRKTGFSRSAELISENFTIGKIAFSRSRLKDFRQTTSVDLRGKFETFCAAGKLLARRLRAVSRDQKIAGSKIVARMGRTFETARKQRAAFCQRKSARRNSGAEISAMAFLSDNGRI